MNQERLNWMIDRLTEMKIYQSINEDHIEDIILELEKIDKEKILIIEGESFIRENDMKRL